MTLHIATERYISATKLQQWVDDAKTGDQRLRRKRWALGYAHGASFRTMTSWQPYTLNTDGIAPYRPS